MTVSELDVRMSSREFMEWIVYSQIEPFGPARNDYHAALISTVVANSQGNKTQPNDFIKPYEFPTTPVVLEGEAPGYSAKQASMMALFKAMSSTKNGSN